MPYVKHNDNLAEDRYVKAWLANIPNKQVRCLYLGHMRTLLKWSGKTPEGLIKMRQAELKTEDPLGRNGVKELVVGFRRHLESLGRAPKTIHTADGCIRGFFSHILGNVGMVNVSNYEHKDVVRSRDFVPTLEELGRLVAAGDTDEKFRLLFMAQTGMRPGDAVLVKYGDVRRELEAGKNPIAIRYLPEKDRGRNIGERIAFIGTDCIEALRQYVRKNKPEDGDPLLGTAWTDPINKMIHRLAAATGIDEGSEAKLRLYSMRKFFITEATNHGMQDKMVNFIIGHSVPAVDLAYWQRRVEDLRQAYDGIQRYLNPSSLSGGGGRREIEESQKGLAYELLAVMMRMNPELAKKVFSEIAEAKLSVLWDPKAEPTPPIYVVQAAARKLLEAER